MILACCSIDLKILPSSHVNKSKFLDFEWIVGRIEGSEWLEVWRNRQRLLSAPEYSSDLTKRLRKYPAVCSRMGFGLSRSSMKSLSQTVGRGTWHLNVWHLLSTSEKSNDLLSHLKIIIGSHPLYETTASPRRYIDTNYNWSLFPRHLSALRLLKRFISRSFSKWRPPFHFQAPSGRSFRQGLVVDSFST